MGFFGISASRDRILFSSFLDIVECGFGLCRFAGRYDSDQFSFEFVHPTPKGSLIIGVLVLVRRLFPHPTAVPRPFSSTVVLDTHLNSSAVNMIKIMNLYISRFFKNGLPAPINSSIRHLS